MCCLKRFSASYWFSQKVRQNVTYFLTKDARGFPCGNTCELICGIYSWFSTIITRVNCAPLYIYLHMYRYIGTSFVFFFLLKRTSWEIERKSSKKWGDKWCVNSIMLYVYILFLVFNYEQLFSNTILSNLYKVV